jgi:hypothetical protein
MGERSFRFSDNWDWQSKRWPYLLQEKLQTPVSGKFNDSADFVINLQNIKKKSKNIAVESLFKN